MMSFDPQDTAARLTKAQRQVLSDLYLSTATTLGCSETIAFNLARARDRRPALVKHWGSGSFTLTEAGALVKAAIA